MRTSKALLIAAWLLGGPVCGEDWPRFRGPDGAGTAANGGAPVSWSAGENLLWRVEAPGHGSSSPVLLGRRLFVTAWTGYGLDADDPGDRDQLRLHVLCLDRDTGKLLWDMSQRASEREQKLTRRVADHGYATPTPVCDESGVYAYFGVSGVFAYTLEGQPKWKAAIGDRTAGFGSAASPILHGDLLIVNASVEGGAVVAFDKDSGEEVWRIDEVVRSWTTPIVARAADGGEELVVNQKNMIRGFDPATGKELWRCDAIEDYIVPCPVAHDGVVYCLGGRSNRCVAVRLGGRGDVTDSHRLWIVNVGANVTSPVYYDGHLYWASDRGVACCLSAKDGSTVYRERLPTRSRLYASIVRAGEHLYVTTRDNGIVVLKAGPKYEVVDRNVLEGDESLFNASPAVVDGRIYLRTHRYLYCLGKKASA